MSSNTHRCHWSFIDAINYSLIAYWLFMDYSWITHLLSCCATFAAYLSNCENSPKKRFSGLQRDSNPWPLRFSAAVLFQLSYEDPYTGGWPIYWVHQPVKGMKHWMKWCELREYKWNDYVTIAVNRNLSNCENSPKKNAEATGSNPVEAPRILFFGLFSQLLKLRFTAMVTYSFHLYSRSSHHFIQIFVLNSFRW